MNSLVGGVVKKTTTAHSGRRQSVVNYDALTTRTPIVEHYDMNGYCLIGAAVFCDAL